MAVFELRKFVAPEFIFGVGARHRAGLCARSLHAKRVLIVTDDGVAATGWLSELLDDLGAEAIDTRVFRRDAQSQRP